MPKFVFAYHGSPAFSSKEESMAHMADWKVWSAGLGDAMVDPGMPVGKSKTVSATGVADDGGSNPLAGVSVVQADTMGGALEMAKTCPHVTLGGTIEVAEAMDMEM